MELQHDSVEISGSSSQNPGPSGIGCLYLFQGGMSFQQSIPIGHHTNQYAQLFALLHVLRRQKQYKKSKCVIFSKCRTVYKGFSEWMHSWHEHEWRRPKNQILENRKLWQEIWTLKEFGVVKQSAKSHFSERANLLAKKAALLSKEKLDEQKEEKRERQTKTMKSDELRKEESQLLEKFMLLSLQEKREIMKKKMVQSKQRD